jgi:hypothetical protein
MTEYLKNQDGTEILPVPMRHRNISLDEQTIERMKYLKEVKGQGTFSDIINRALKQYFEAEFVKLGIQHYTDPGFEARSKAIRQRIQDESNKRDQARLLKLAQAKILQDEAKRIKEWEEKHGKKFTLKEIDPVKVEILQKAHYERKLLQPGEKVTIAGDVARRWEDHGICKIIGKAK